MSTPFATDWTTIERSFPYKAAMQACVQDPVYHAEGDVFTHTKMVMDALAQVGRADDHTLRLTALYHDVMKPRTRTVQFEPDVQREVVHHPRHSSLGAIVTWHDLWRAGEDLETRLQVYWLIRWHQKVFHMWNDLNIRDILTFAMVSKWPDLIDFAQADTLGRISHNAQETFDILALLRDHVSETMANEQATFDRFRTSAHDRMFYLQKLHRHHEFRPPPPAGSRVVMLSGLPGSGKDRHCATVLSDWPVVSLDAIRRRMKIKPTANQGVVIQAAMEEARVFLRAKKPFVWNGQGLNRGPMSRGKILSLCYDYDAYVSIHAFDRPLATILKQNAQRERDDQVPESVILANARKWEPPSILEAHEVVWV